MSKIPFSSKFAYGFGQIGEQVKNIGFNTFLFFYFTQVLGLSGSLAGLAVLIALAFDAITDPVAGSLSDNWQGKRGRRHPFMYASALPLAITWIILFNPPAGLGQWGLFAWLTGFAILVRASMTLYHVPHLAMGAELSDDYHERTSIVAFRTVLGTLGAVLTVIISYRYFFPSTPEFENGMLNPAGYPRLALFGGIVMCVTIWYSAWGTRRHISDMPRAPEHPEPFSFRRVGLEFASAWQNVSFRSLFVGFTLYGLYFGIVSTLGTHINVFFWEFDTELLQLLALPSAIGFVIGALLCGVMHRRIDKMPSLVTACIATALVGSAPIVLRVLGWFPENGSPYVIYIILGVLSFNATLGAVGFISAGSMMADVAEQHVLRSGKAQQGIFFSSTAFSGKLASGLGHAIAGVGIDLISFPLKAEPSAVPELAIRNLGLLTVGSAVLTLVAIWVFRYYAITRDVQEKTRIALAERDAAASEVAGSPDAAQALGAPGA